MHRVHFRSDISQPHINCQNSLESQLPVMVCLAANNNCIISFHFPLSSDLIEKALDTISCCFVFFFFLVAIFKLLFSRKYPRAKVINNNVLRYLLEYS